MSDDKLKRMARDLILRAVTEDDHSVITRALADDRLTKDEVGELGRVIANMGGRIAFTGGMLAGANTFARDGDEEPAAEPAPGRGWLQ